MQRDLIANELKLCDAVAITHSGLGFDLVETKLALCIDNPRRITIVEHAHIEISAAFAYVLGRIRRLAGSLRRGIAAEGPDFDTSATGQKQHQADGGQQSGTFDLVAHVDIPMVSKRLSCHTQNIL